MPTILTGIERPVRRLLKIIFFGAFIFSTTWAIGQESISLNGKWEIIFDHSNEGRINKWYFNSGFENHPDKREIEVPGCWEEIEQDYEGVAFYRKSFVIPAGWKGKIIHLNFEAVNYVAEVWLNNHVIDFHQGGFTPFSFRIDESANFGEENVLTMRVIGPIILTDKYIDNIGRQETPQWRGGIVGGIWQPVSISATGLVSLDDVYIETDIRKNTASFTLDIESHTMYSTQADISLSIFSPDGATLAHKSLNLSLLPGPNKEQWIIQIPDAQYWSLDNPYLYVARVEIVHDGNNSDVWVHKFGLREFTIRENKFYFNDHPIYLKAAFFEGLYPTRIAYPDSREMAIREIMLAKKAGFNMIRPWRKPPPKMWLDLCDSIGILTVGSIVVECMDRPVSTPYLAKRVELEIRESVMRDRNRTCVVQWELFNEANRPVLQQMMHPMCVLTQKLDPGRLILDESGGTKGAWMYLPYEDNPIRINDIHTYPGGQVTQEQYDRCLIIGTTKEEQMAMGLNGLRMPGRNVQSHLFSYLSELGYASWPDIVQNNQAFQQANLKVPAAVSHQRLEEQLREAFKVTGFNKAFPDLQKYCLEEQRIHGIANKRMIEATRSNPLISGYCIHALTDGDWILGASILDLWRNPKSHAYQMTKEANQPQIVSIRILPRNIYAEKGGRIQITGINEGAGSEVNVTLRIETTGGQGIHTETFTADMKNGVSQLYNEFLKTIGMSGQYIVKVVVKDASNKLLTVNEQSFDVFNDKDLEKPTVKVALLDRGNYLAKHFENNGIDYVAFSNDIDLSVPVIVGEAEIGDERFHRQAEDVKSFVERGGYAVFLKVRGENLTWGAPNKQPRNNDEGWTRRIPRVLTDMNVNNLPFNADIYSTSGNYISRNHIVTDNDVFKDLPVNMLMSDVYENVCPTISICRPAEGKYLAGVISYDQNKNMDIMLRHYNGIGDVFWAADVLLVDKGKGKILYSTLNIIENLGKDPVADKILYNMIGFNKNQ